MAREVSKARVSRGGTLRRGLIIDFECVVSPEQPGPETGYGGHWEVRWVARGGSRQGHC